MPQEQEDLWINEVNIGSGKTSEPLALEKDDFSQDSETILQLQGLSQNFKRAARRKLNKALTSASGEIIETDGNVYAGDGAGSKQIIPGKYGYGIFDVVEPAPSPA